MHIENCYILGDYFIVQDEDGKKISINIQEKDPFGYLIGIMDEFVDKYILGYISQKDLSGYRKLIKLCREKYINYNKHKNIISERST